MSDSLVPLFVGDDEVGRLLALLDLLSTAENNVRSLGLVVLGLALRLDPMNGSREIAAAVRTTDTIAAQYRAAADEVFEALKSRQPAKPETAVVLH